MARALVALGRKRGARSSTTRSPTRSPRRNEPVGFADFASRNGDHIAPETVRMFEPTDLVQLPKGEALAYYFHHTVMKLSHLTALLCRPTYPRSRPTW